MDTNILKSNNFIAFFSQLHSHKQTKIKKYKRQNATNYTLRKVNLHLRQTLHWLNLQMQEFLKMHRICMAKKFNTHNKKKRSILTAMWSYCMLIMHSQLEDKELKLSKILHEGMKLSPPRKIPKIKSHFYKVVSLCEKRG